MSLTKAHRKMRIAFGSAVDSSVQVWCVMALWSKVLAKVSIAVIFLLALVPHIVAQPSNAKSPPAAPQTASGTPDVKEALLFESIRNKATYQDDGSGTLETTAVVRMLSQAGVQGSAVLRFAYSSADQTVEFDYVRVRKPDGTVVVTPDYNVQDMPAEATRDAPMYSDIHEKHVTVKALGVGDTLEYLVRYRTTKPQVPGQFWVEYTFPKDVIAKDEELEIDVPRDKYVKVVSPDYPPQTKEEGGRRIYSWKTANAVRKETDSQTSLPRKQGAPQPSVQVTTFHSWEDVGRWYGELQRSQVVVTPQIQAKAAELTKGLSSDADKIKAIYSFVSTKYHYVSLSFGIGRYQPHLAGEVFENEYGDCKDKHTLLAALLKAAGYDAWPVLINSNRKINSDVPSPGQFDHLITVVSQGGTLLWLDTTPGVAPFGMLRVNLRDKQALVMPTGKPAVLMTTPANPPFPAMQTFTATGKLSGDGTFTGHMQLISRGDSEVIDRFVFQHYPSAQWKDVLQQISYQWGFAGDVSGVTASDPADVSKPFEFSYDYKREKMGDWDNHRITAPFPLLGVEAAALEKKKPEEPVFLSAPGTIVYKAQVELPPGYTAKLPANVDLSEDYADFHATYEVKLGVLTATRRLVVKKAEVPPSNWNGYQKFAKAVSDDKDTWIDIVPVGEKTEVSVTPRTFSPEANRAFQEGAEAMQHRDITRAEESFRYVLELQPNYPGAHGNLGVVYLAAGSIDAGKRELRKEEELNPNEPFAYATLARVLTYQHDNAGAIEQLQKLLTIDPKNRDAALNLGQLLMIEKRYSEEVTVLEKALAFARDSGALKYNLGYAYIRNGEKDKGLSLLDKALTADQDTDHGSIALNDVAYSLIDMDVGLDVAQRYAAKSLEQLEAESLKAGTGHDGLMNTSFLGATWDTVGWIQFRLGHYDQALSYLRASWILSRNSETGDHLAQLYAKMGKKHEAEHVFRLAFAAPGQDARQPNPAATMHEITISQNIKRHYQDLMGKDADPGSFTTSRKADGTFTATPAEELSRMRLVKITTATHPAAHGAVSIVFLPGKVEEVTLVDGDESLKALAEQIKTAKFDVEFPNSDPARLVRRGILSCGSRGCDLALMLPEDRSLLAAE